VRNLLHPPGVSSQATSPIPQLSGDTAADAPNEDFEPWAAETIARQRALRAAVLIDAIRCLAGAASIHEQRAQQHAMRWITSRDTNAPFSFHNVCEALGFDPARLRRLLLTPLTGGVRSPWLAILGGRAPSRVVRRPRRPPIRYVVLDGGQKS